MGNNTVIDDRAYEKSVIRHVILTCSRNYLENICAMLYDVDFVKVDLAAQRLSKRLNTKIAVVKEQNQPLSVKCFPKETPKQNNPGRSNQTRPSACGCYTCNALLPRITVGNAVCNGDVVHTTLAGEVTRIPQWGRSRFRFIEGDALGVGWNPFIGYQAGESEATIYATTPAGSQSINRVNNEGDRDPFGDELRPTSERLVSALEIPINQLNDQFHLCQDSSA